MPAMMGMIVEVTCGPELLNEGDVASNGEGAGGGGG